MAHFEADNSNGWGVSLDYGFMDLRQDTVGPLGGVADLRVRQGVFEALLKRRKDRENGYVETFVGFRWWDNDITANASVVVIPGDSRVDINEDWIDLVVGARWVRPLNEKWKFSVQGDFGGLGLQSDWTTSWALGFRYNISDLLDLNMQYKASWVDYENGSFGQPGYYAYDTVTHGPLIGLAFKF